MEFFDYDNKLEPKKGRLLVSEPFLPDPNFERTVVLLCEHNNEGSFGFILNKPSNLYVDQVMADIIDYPAPLFIGGPVDQNSFHYIHKNENLSGAKKIGSGIYWGGDFEQLKYEISSGNASIPDYKYFVGYSGWDVNQLDEEIKAGSWIVVNSLNSVTLFSLNTDQLWKQALNSLGGRFKVYSNYPTDPRMN